MTIGKLMVRILTAIAALVILNGPAFAVPVTINPGSYTGLWGLSPIPPGNFFTGQQTLDLAPGTHFLRVGTTGFIGINVDATGNVAPSGPQYVVSIMGGLNQATFLTRPVTVDVGAYAGKWEISRVRNAATGSDTIDLVPSDTPDGGTAYVVSVGIGTSSFFVRLAGDGSLTIDNTDAAVDDSGILRFANTTVFIQDQSGSGANWSIRQVTGLRVGDDSVVHVPGLQYFFEANGAGALYSIAEPCAANPSSLNLNGIVFALSCGGNLIVANDKILSIAPASGTTTVVAESSAFDPLSLFSDARGLRVGPGGEILVADGLGVQVIEIGPSGAQTVIAAGAPMVRPGDLELGQGGAIFVRDDGAPQIVKIDGSGVQTVLAASGDLGAFTLGMRLAPDGSLTVISGTGAIVKVDTGTGATQVLFSASTAARAPAYSLTGDLILPRLSGSNTFIDVRDPINGNVLSTVGPIAGSARGTAVGQDGSLFLSTVSGAVSTIYRVDLATQNVSIVSQGDPSGGLFFNVFALDFAPPLSQAPVAVAIVEQLTDIGADALVRLDGLDSSDPNNLISELTFRWTVDLIVVCEGDHLTCGRITVPLSFGSHEVVLLVTDPDGNFDEKRTPVVIDPASLAVLEIDKAEVDFGATPPEVEIRGTIGLPFGVNFSELSPLATVVIDVAAVETVPFAFVTLVAGNGGSEWTFEDEFAFPGITKFHIDWKGARFRFKAKDFPVQLKSRLITTVETLLEVRLKPRKISDPFTMDIDGQATVEFASDGTVVLSTVPVEVKEPRLNLVLSLPFPLTDLSTITFSGGLNRVVLVGDDLKGSVGRYRLDATFDGAFLFPAGVATTPRTLDLELTIGAQAYPGDASLGPNDLEVHGDEWESTAE